MKILTVLSVPPWSKEGQARVVGETAKRLSASTELDLEIWCGTPAKGCRGTWHGVSVRAYRTRNWVGYGSLPMFRDLRNEARSFDLIHAHGSSTLVPLMAAYGCSEIPLIVSPHFHAEASASYLNGPKRAYDLTCNSRVFNKARRIICVSKTERKSIQERFELRRPVSIIPNGISLKQIENAQPYAVDRKLILSVGRLERYKNNHRLVEAMRYLSSDEFSLCIIGSGKFRGELEQQIRRHGLSDSVKILGSRSDDEVYRWMKTCSVFVNLSNVEAFGITVLEALAAHSRVIVNDKFGLRELSRKFTKAIIPVDVKTMHPRDLAQVIRETAETRVNGVNLSEFDWNAISKRIKETYLEVAAETDAR